MRIFLNKIEQSQNYVVSSAVPTLAEDGVRAGTVIAFLDIDCFIFT